MPPKVSASATSTATTAVRPPVLGSIINQDGTVLSIVGSISVSPTASANSSPWTNRMEGVPGSSSLQLSEDSTSRPPRTKARSRHAASVGATLCASRASSASATSTPGPPQPTSAAAKQKSARTKPKSAKKPKTASKSNAKKRKEAKGAGDIQTKPVKNMCWTVPLTKLALETRFKDRRILYKFAKKTNDTKKIRATWETAVNDVLERAAIENTWGDGEEGQLVTVSQFKNKINAIRKAYRAKRTRMLSTGNRTTSSDSDEDDNERRENEEREFPEMPTNFLLNQGEAVDEVGRRILTCDPVNVRPEYRREHGNELAALWPLLCDVFSSNPGLTGEAITESGLGGGSDHDVCDDVSSESDIQIEEACSDTPSDARAKAKTAAKAKKQQRQLTQPDSKRPAELLNDTLRDGFSSFERIFESRQSNQTNTSMAVMVNKSTTRQQETSQAICQSITSLQQTTADLFKEMMKQFKGPNSA